MIGLILKDIFNLRKTFKTLAFMLAVYIVLFSISGNDASFIAGMIVIMFTMLSITSFSYDDLAKWDKYALSLPITRKEVVLSKYLLALLLSVCGTALAAIVAFLGPLFTGKTSGETGEQLLTLYAIFALSVLFICIILPLLYKFGVEKSRLILIAVMGLPTLITILLLKQGVHFPSEQQLMHYMKLSPLLLILLFAASFFISFKIFSGKDI